MPLLFQIFNKVHLCRRSLGSEDLHAVPSFAASPASTLGGPHRLPSSISLSGRGYASVDTSRRCDVAQKQSKRDMPLPVGLI